MDIQFSATPQMFGVFHIAALAVIALGCVGAYFALRRMDETRLLRLIWILGGVMLAMEVWKQGFSWVYVFDRQINLWFFPWQLCSMAMYCAFAVRFVRGQRQNTLLVFLSTFSLFAAVVALAVPSDMLRPYVLLTVHGFLYHGLMIVLALAAMLVVFRRENVQFAPAVRLFVWMAAVAEIINVAAHSLLHDIHREPNMFFITPYYESTQPVLHEIALKLGIPAEIAIYLLSIIAISFGVFCAERALMKKRPPRAGDA